MRKQYLFLSLFIFPLSYVCASSIEFKEVKASQCNTLKVLGKNNRAWLARLSQHCPNVKKNFTPYSGFYQAAKNEWKGYAWNLERRHFKRLMEAEGLAEVSSIGRNLILYKITQSAENPASHFSSAYAAFLLRVTACLDGEYAQMASSTFEGWLEDRTGNMLKALARESRAYASASPQSELCMQKDKEKPSLTYLVSSSLLSRWSARPPSQKLYLNVKSFENDYKGSELSKFFTFIYKAREQRAKLYPDMQ